MVMAVRKIRLRKRCSGSIGCGATFSCAISAARPTPPSRKQTQAVGESQSPLRWINVMPISTGVQATTISSAPGQSMRGRPCGRGRRLSWNQVAAKAAAPSGRLIQKIQCQERYSTKSPPSTGPQIFAVAKVAER